MKQIHKKNGDTSPESYAYQSNRWAFFKKDHNSFLTPKGPPLNLKNHRILAKRGRLSRLRDGDDETICFFAKFTVMLSTKSHIAIVPPTINLISLYN